MTSSEDHAQRAIDITQSIKPLLRGQGPDIQGAVLLELTAFWLAGHPPQLRTAVLQMHLAALPAMLDICELELFGAAGHPSK